MGRVGTLLDEREKRKILMVLSREAYNTMEREGHGGLILNPNISVIKYDDLVKRHPNNGHFMQHNLFPDDVLLQSPFDQDLYEPASEALYSYSVAKHHLVSELCQHLGCKQLEITHVDIISEKETRMLEIKANHPAVAVSGSAATVDEQSICSEFLLSDDYNGSAVDIEAAEQFLLRNGLSGDIDLASLVRKRKNSVNPLQTHYVKVTLTSESKRSLDILVGISIPSLSASLDTALKRIKETRREYKVTYKATFL